MNATAVLAALYKNQLALYVITMLQLTGFMFPPPAKLQNDDAFDYIIIGGGTCGSVIASRLVQQKYNVLVIEAGQDPPFESTLPGIVPYLENSQSEYNYTTDDDGYSYRCQKDQVIDLHIGKMLGGSSELNYMVYSRGNRKTYNKWARITNDSTWLWKNVLPYFLKSENISDSAIENSQLNNFFGHEGYIGVTRDTEPCTDQFLEGFRQAGKEIVDDIDGNRLGYSRGLITVKDGFRQGAGTSYFSKISESRYIAVAKNTTAIKIIFNKSKVAKGVEVITDEGKIITLKARQEIIVAAGAIKSPQILMLSGIGPEKELKKLNINTISDLPVGKGLQDHVATFIPFKLNTKIDTDPRDPGKLLTGLFVGYASLNNSKDYEMYPDYTVIGQTARNTKNLLQLCASRFNFPNRLCNKLADEAKNNQVLIALIGDLHALSRGQVSLRTTNPLDSPKVLPDGFSYDEDLEAMVDYVYDFLKVEESDAFKRLVATRIDLTNPRCDVFKKDSREYWRCYILCMMVTLRSYSGTCAMGSVVDSRLRVKGVSGLRVADASIMPTISTGVTHNTVIMIGEKVSDMIMEDAGLYNKVEHEMIREDQIKNMPF